MEKGSKGKPSRVAIYARESRDENGEKVETIETQRDLLIHYVKENSLGEVCRIYMDDNASGAGFERKGIELLEMDAQRGDIDLLVIKDLSRLGRNNAKTLAFLDFLEECGVRVITYDGRYDSLKDNETVGIDTWYNERYIRDISQKTRASLKYKISRGEYIGTAPYGYAKSSVEKNRLVIDPGSAMVVKEIYNYYLEGYGYSSIAKILDKCGYPPPSSKSMRPGRSWSPATVKRILSNRVYVGDTVQGVSEKVSFKSKKTRRLPEDMWTFTPNTHEAIIDREIFHKVQELRESRKPGAISHKKHSLFRGMVYCGGCGSPMIGRRRKNRPMGYICAMYARFGRKACSSHHIREEYLYEIVYDEILKILDSYSAEEYENIKRKLLACNKDTINSIDVLKAQLEKKKRQQDILYLDRIEGKIRDGQFFRLNTIFENEIAFLTQKINELAQKRTEEYDVNFKENVKSSFYRNGLDEKLINLIVNEIIIYAPGENPAYNGECTSENSNLHEKFASVVFNFRH